MMVIQRSLNCKTNFDDITETKKAEKEIKKINEELEQRVSERTMDLLEVNKELEAFSYSVSHDLRAPLRAISGFTNILSHEYKNIMDAEALRICKIIESNAHRMGQLIDDLLSFSQIGRSEIHRTRIDMNEMVRRVYLELTREIKLDALRLSVQQIPDCYCDNALIRQVWTNLLSNALKYSSKSEHPEITVGFEQNQEEIVYFVSDNGVGFEMEYVNKLFGVFQRLHSSAEFEGTGVGLAIVQRIIQRHNGRVWAEGILNKGATFFFTIPIKSKES